LIAGVAFFEKVIKKAIIKRVYVRILSLNFKPLLLFIGSIQQFETALEVVLKLAALSLPNREVCLLFKVYLFGEIPITFGGLVIIGWYIQTGTFKLTMCHDSFSPKYKIIW
jgi:hypothetical protein